MRPVIRQGDTLHPYGGQVQEGQFEAFGKPLAYRGAAAQCNEHGLTVIAEGSAIAWLTGRAVALQGHACACGCTLVSSLPVSAMGVQA